jgi:hypothetical protein
MVTQEMALIVFLYVHLFKRWGSAGDQTQGLGASARPEFKPQYRKKTKIIINKNKPRVLFMIDMIESITKLHTSACLKDFY